MLGQKSCYRCGGNVLLTPTVDNGPEPKCLQCGRVQLDMVAPTGKTKDSKEGRKVNELTAREQLCHWYEEQIEGQSELYAPDLAAKAVSWVEGDLAKNAEERRQAQELRKKFLLELFYPMAYELLRQVLRNKRDSSPPPANEDDAEGGGGAEAIGEPETPQERHERIRQAFKYQYDTFMERALKRHVLVMNMTREELLDAALNRRKMVERHTELAVLWVDLAKDLRDGERVRDRFTVHDIEKRRIALQKRLSERYKALGLDFGPSSATGT